MGLGQQFLEPGILLFQFLQSLGLIDLQPAVLTTPAVVGLLSDLLLPSRFGRFKTLGDMHFDRTKLTDDLFRLLPFPCHVPALS